MKKQTLLFVAALTLSTLAGAGCGSMLGTNAAPTSLPVQLQTASTNDPNAVAWLRLIKAANENLNPTPTKEPVDALMGGAIALVASLAGWYSRHKSSAVDTASTAALCANFKPTPPPTPPPA